MSKHLNDKIKRALRAPAAAAINLASAQKTGQKTEQKPEVKAQWSDDKLVYVCQDLIRACTDALRTDGLDPQVSSACEDTVVCATVCCAHFNYADESSLAERIGACNNLSQCCQGILAVVGNSADLKTLLVCAELCLAQCQETAGNEVDEGDGPAHSEEDTTDAAVVVSAKDPPKKSVARKDWLKVEARADGVHMSVCGFIGDDLLDESGTSSDEFTEALAKIDNDQHIHVHVDSEGGSLPAGIKIYNSLKDRRPNVTTHVDGVALSCASLIALAGQTVISPAASVWMIHSARIQTYGDDQEHERSIKMLRSFSDMMADVYAEETGHDKDEILKLMEKETWFTGTEAVAFGLADDTEDHVATEDPDQMDEDNQKDQGDWAGARAHAPRYDLIMAMYRPPEKVRELISARNHAVGAAGTKSSRESSIMATKDNQSVAAPATTASNPFEARLIQERTARITAEVGRRAEGRALKNEQLAWWVKTAMDTVTSQEEQGVYAQLESLPAAVAKAAPGGAPLAGDATPQAAVEASGSLRWGDPTPRPRTAFGERVHRLPDAMARRRHSVRAWGDHLSWCMREDLKTVNPNMPLAANTYSSTLITDFLVDVATTVLQNRWAALSCVSRDFSTDLYKPLATAQCKLVTAGSSTLVGTKGSPITNFEQGGGTVRNVPVVINHYSQPVSTTQDELMNGLRLENLLTINLAALADTIMGNVWQSLVAGGVNSAGSLVAFSAGTCNAPAGTFTWNSNPGAPTLWAYLKKSPIKNLVLDGVYLANLINNPYFYQETFNGERASDRAKVFGWDNIQANTTWPSSLSNLGGVAMNPQAIFAVAGLPMSPPVIPGATLAESVMTIPGPDINLQNYTWFSLASRTMFTSFDLMFGSAGGDATAAALLFNQKGSVS